jgi:hypothetical protein
MSSEGRSIPGGRSSKASSRGIQRGATNWSAPTSIAWGVELLAHNPAVAERARSEEVYPEATVKEVLRLYPPLPVAAARHPLEPFAIGHWTIPPGF